MNTSNLGNHADGSNTSKTLKSKKVFEKNRLKIKNFRQSKTGSHEKWSECPESSTSGRKEKTARRGTSTTCTSTTRRTSTGFRPLFHIGKKYKV